jgi:hypothetical protein
MMKVDDERKQNIVIFCAGQSVTKASRIVTALNKEFNCVTWENIFTARDGNKKSLLPMLIKKIPTFDFALILGDGVDVVEMGRKTPEVHTIMRDNVLLECGLCITALGPDRVILLVEKGVRIPEDIEEVEENGVKIIKYAKGDESDLLDQIEHVKTHVDQEKNVVSPIVIGAAISTADGYHSNFILRFWENVGGQFLVANSTKFELSDPSTITEYDFPDPSKIKMKILIPMMINTNIGGKIHDHYKREGYTQGIIPDANFRGVMFHYKMNKDGMTICDIPSTVTASVGTVKDILELEADDDFDGDAESRFLNKELESFNFTLKKLMTEEAIRRKLAGFRKYFEGPDAEKNIQNILGLMKQVEIEKINLEIK